MLNINNKKLFDESLELFCKYDASIGYSDCTTIEMMKKYEIDYIISYDSDFDKKDGIIRIYNFKDDKDNVVTNIEL